MSNGKESHTGVRRLNPICAAQTVNRRSSSYPSVQHGFTRVGNLHKTRMFLRAADPTAP